MKGTLRCSLSALGPQTVPYLARPFVDIRSPRDTTTLPSWMSENQRQYANFLFSRTIAAHPVLVAQTIHRLPLQPFPQVAVIGKSNVGKSSLINALMHGKEVTRTSSTPGRTRHLFTFDLGDQLSLVDLPGYGFAKVAKERQNDWAVLIEEYFNRSRSLKRVISLIEGPTGIGRLDEKLWEMMVEKNRQFMVVITKVDTLKPLELHALMLRVIASLEGVRAEAQSRDCRSDIVWPFVHAVAARYNEGMKELRCSLSVIASDHHILEHQTRLKRGAMHR
uniref:EngB-type G domain-containing protein n=1 Tax=Chromera velia CCMP2878 TaxID=1169474 RepID=A0A0G4HVK4_9ALVE|eukprot:Cvel_8881.t1-p1 / transcript=Cvel_8881.t1 / gene=Cvel_8881 / organism=Chromera_velia_CCMP2878 / gene_product=Probable GTP-binding protein EngB, putative / transcript_product=Probable GTP-binding protein EngB, putative / location=Cvel_scaffold499:67095-71534(-) / protein_length=277 / sequence_SO=supercontig / SO=protein_coding / is_pseudo=false